MSENIKPILEEYEKEDMYERQHDAYAHAKYEILLSWLADTVHTSQRILNVGCGSGELCFLLAQQGHLVVGIDPAEEYISMASAQAGERSLSNCSFIVSDLKGIFNTQQQYDVVFSTDVVEHISDDVQAIEQLTALVKPGGNLFITVPGGQYLFGFHDEQLGHYRRYSLNQLAKLLPSSLKLLKIRYFGFSLIPVAWFYSQLLRRYYPVSKTGNKKTNPILAQIVNCVMYIEKKIHPPLGTSCLLLAKKENNN